MEVAYVEALHGMSGIAAAAFVQCLQPRRCYDSLLSGSAFTQELINGHPVRIKNLLRVTKETFLRMCDTLTVRGLIKPHVQTRVGVHEAVAIFLHTIAHSNRHCSRAERFQHSTHTIWHHVKRVSEVLCLLRFEVVSPGDQSITHPRIANNRHFMPFFKDCVGAFDGTLIHASVPVADAPHFRSRHGHTEQSILAVVDHDIRFVYVYTGFEGSAHDSRVLNHAIAVSQDFPLPPPSKYYLADSAYTNSALTLTPFRSHRYHSQTFRDTPGGPRGPKELFNYRHSQLRNVVEQAFGVRKQRFAILRGPMPIYKFYLQVNLVQACATVHNLMVAAGENVENHDGEGSEPALEETGNSTTGDPLPDEYLELFDNPHRNQFREHLANRMWTSRDW
ncbi:uncharacterized protein LOC127241690 [Andrographis paniculata]|uniref:uncharacterized protein LOC127241690 n=1 Tax=Andrographis paniculata TaxID=175694 RepID=UPI0021E88298|nr:uncharacterized protein LOC127241690 [Andrographis paniculata]